MRIRVLSITLTGIASLMLALVGPIVVSAAGSNLVNNSSVESVEPTDASRPAGWYKDTYGTNTATFSYMNTGAYSGSKSVYVKVAAYTNGDSKWMFDPVVVKPSTDYTISDFYKSSVATQVMVRQESTAGVVSYQWVKTAPISAAWKAVSATVKTNADTKSLSVLHLINKKGWLQVDNMSIAETNPVVTPPPTPPSGNLFDNPSLETVDPANANLPKSWKSAKSGTNNATFTYMTNGHTGSRSAKMQMSTRTSGAAQWAPTAVPVQGGKMYEFTAFTKSTVGSEIDAEITLSDGSVDYKYIGWVIASPNEWSKFYTNFTVPANATKVSLSHTLTELGSVQIDDYSLKQFNPVGFSQGMVSLTFDDGLLSTKTNVVPALNTRGYDGTFYLMSNNINQAGNITTADLNSFKNDGHEIAAHTVTHPHLPLLTPSELAYELQEPQDLLRSWTGAPVRNFASPYGEYNPTVVNAILGLYRSHRSVDSGYNSKDNFEIGNIKVQNIYRTTTAAEVAQWAAYAKQSKTWLVLVYHAVEQPAAGAYDTTPTIFKAQLDAITATGISVKTVDQALDLLVPQL